MYMSQELCALRPQLNKFEHGDGMGPLRGEWGGGGGEG